MKFDEAKEKVESAARDLNSAIAKATLAGYGVNLSKNTRPARADLAAGPQVAVEVGSNWQETKTPETPIADAMKHVERTAP